VDPVGYTRSGQHQHAAELSIPLYSIDSQISQVSNRLLLVESELSGYAQAYCLKPLRCIANGSHL
jgi:hypothetical protein